MFKLQTGCVFHFGAKLSCGTGTRLVQDANSDLNNGLSLAKANRQSRSRAGRNCVHLPSEHHIENCCIVAPTYEYSEDFSAEFPANDISNRASERKISFALLTSAPTLHASAVWTKWPLHRHTILIDGLPRQPFFPVPRPSSYLGPRRLHDSITLSQPILSVKRGIRHAPPTTGSHRRR